MAKEKFTQEKNCDKPIDVRNCHYNQGTTTIYAFVFSCPGAEECCVGMPVAGQTGKNLDNFMKRVPAFRDFNSRYDIRITNAWDRVESRGLTGRTEAKKGEIKAPSNLSRLALELQDITRVIICFGRKAEYAVKLIEGHLHRHPQVLYNCHLGFQSLNRWKCGYTQTGLTINEKLDLLANDLIRQMDNTA